MSAKKFLDFSGLLSYHDNLISLIRNDEQVIAQAIEGLASDLEEDEEVIATALNNLKETLDEIESNAATVSDVNALSGTSSEIPVETLVEIEEAVEGAETVDADLNGSVISITNRNGQTKSIDVLNATQEVVQIVVTSDVQGVDVEGLVINAYYNGSSTPTATVTTDANGMGALRVPNGYQYRLVFPVIAGCAQIPDVIHTATVSQRAVEVEYTEPRVDMEHVDLLVRTYSSVSSSTPTAGQTVSVTTGGVTTQYVTGNNGQTSFDIPIGQSYTISTTPPEGYYIDNRRTQLTRTAAASQVDFTIRLRPWQTGLFIMGDDGVEYSFDEWKALVNAAIENAEQTKGSELTEEEEATVAAGINNNAKFIKVATAMLYQNSGIFYVEIDAMRNRTYLSKQWMTANNALPELGYNTYQYDGMTATEKIIDEATELGYTVPAAVEAYSKTYTVGGRTLQGFLLGLSQMEQLWGARTDIDEILTYVRPNGSYLLSTLTTAKWTSTQLDATTAWVWTTSAVNGFKGSSYVVLPAFAY